MSRVPALTRLVDVDAWKRFAASGGFEALASPAPAPSASKHRYVEPGLTDPRRRVCASGESLAERWMWGETLQEIADEFGVSKERIRQLIQRYLAATGTSPEEIRRAKKRDRRAATASRDARAIYEELLRRMSAGRHCEICGGYNLRDKRTKTCSTECAALMKTTARYWTSPERHENHRRQVAQSVLRHPDKYSDRTVEHARAVLSDAPPPPNRRYVSRSNRDLARHLGVSFTGAES